MLLWAFQDVRHVKSRNTLLATNGRTLGIAGCSSQFALGPVGDESNSAKCITAQLLMDSNRFQIRSAKPAEHRCLSDLGMRSKKVWGYGDAMMARFRRELTLSARYVDENEVRVAVMERNIVAYASLTYCGNRVTELEHLFVDPDYMNHGIGTALFQDAIRLTTAAGNSKLVIQCDPNAIGFYERQGLRVTKFIPSSVAGRSIPFFEHALECDQS